MTPTVAGTKYNSFSVLKRKPNLPTSQTVDVGMYNSRCGVALHFYYPLYCRQRIWLRLITALNNIRGAQTSRNDLLKQAAHIACAHIPSCWELICYFLFISIRASITRQVAHGVFVCLYLDCHLFTLVGFRKYCKSVDRRE